MNATVLSLLWMELVQCFQNTLILTTLTPQTAILGILEFINYHELSRITKEYLLCARTS